MRLIEKITSIGNMELAITKVKSNKRAPVMDKITVDEIDGYFHGHEKELIKQIRERRYQPYSVRRTYISKSNGKKRPLGIPVVVDRGVRQATAQQLNQIYD